MTITITIDNMPVEVRIVHYLPPEPPKGLYGPGSAAEVVWVGGPDWLHAVAEHFDLWKQIDKMVLGAIAERIKQQEGEV